MTPVLQAGAVPPLYHPETLRAAFGHYLGTRAKAEEELGWQPRPSARGWLRRWPPLRQKS